MSNHPVVGIDVGGKKGFHAVALIDNRFADRTVATDPTFLLHWCLKHNATVVAVDCPCGWSAAGKSRQTERDLMSEGINCFSTPTRQSAEGRAFYGWVFNGESLYQTLMGYFRLFDGIKNEAPTCIETFPQAVVCALAGRVVRAKPKNVTRRKALTDLGYDTANLSNVDFVDAALCAITALRFQENRYKYYGTADEGMIVVPTIERYSTTKGMGGIAPITYMRATLPTNLPVVLGPGEDGWIIAECPAIPGCISQGRTRDEALQNIREAIDLCLESQEAEGWKLPQKYLFRPKTP